MRLDFTLILLLLSLVLLSVPGVPPPGGNGTVFPSPGGKRGARASIPGGSYAGNFTGGPRQTKSSNPYRVATQDYVTFLRVWQMTDQNAI